MSEKKYRYDVTWMFVPDDGSPKGYTMSTEHPSTNPPRQEDVREWVKVTEGVFKQKFGITGKAFILNAFEVQ